MVLSAGPAHAEFGLMTKWGTSGSGAGQFDLPRGIAIGPSGEVYVSDSDNDRVQKFTPNGRFLTKWGSQGTAPGQFITPEGIATDAAGNVYVADQLNDRIQKFTPGGGLITLWGTKGSGDGQFDLPQAVATDAAGNVYVADAGNYRVQKFTSSGAFLTKWDGADTADGDFDYPIAVATDPAGDVYVTEAFEDDGVQKFTSDGAFIAQFAPPGTGEGELYIPSGVAADGAENVYVIDEGGPSDRPLFFDGARVQQFTSGGRFIREFGCPGKEGGQLSNPQALATDAAGSVYVADNLNNRVQKFGDPGAPLPCVLEAYRRTSHKPFRVVVSAICYIEDCEVKARGVAKGAGVRATLPRVKRSLEEDVFTKLRLRFRSHEDFKELRRAVNAHRGARARAKARVHLRAADSAGELETERIRVKLVG
jgi:DNA-binding beta-propeller fold protein YncE